MVQGRLGRRVPKMGLHVLDGGELGHVRRTGTPEHLMRDSCDTGALAGLLQHSKQEIVGVYGRSAA